MKDNLFSIVICTFNRSEFLESCLDSVIIAKQPESNYDVLVIDNNSTDDTNIIANRFCKNHENILYYFEKNQGLSYARNRGYKESRSKYLFYLDDDAKATDNLLNRIEWLCNMSNVDIAGGLFLPWYKYGKPYWYKDKYASNLKDLQQFGILPKQKYASGGVFLIKRSLLHHHGGFKTELGMMGNSTGYGEETELQIRLRKNGYHIFFDPKLIIDHVVAEYKLSTNWFLRSSLALGKDLPATKKIKANLFNILKLFVIMTTQLAILGFVNSFRLLRKRYYIENWLIDTFRKPVKRFGAIKQLIHLSSISN